MPDKFAATWVSHSSISEYLKCPRAYYLKNVYRDPKTKHKVQLMAPPLALGSAVHEVLESLSVVPTTDRFNRSLVNLFQDAWKKVSGKQGGFFDGDAEQRYKLRGEAMLRRVMEHPGPLLNLAVKIKEDLPYYWLSEEDNIILCGKIDWLEYLPESDSVHIIDFKTGQNQENDQSLQLPIYHLLVHNCQHRAVTKASYWYLEHDDELSEKTLPDLDTAHEQVIHVAQQIKTARSLERYKCPQGDGCFACRPMEAILQRKAEFVGVNDYGADVYILPPVDSEELIEESSFLL
jgi:ATP-dependent helicase/DNAse subunit B